ncbi:MAG: hypothetical protein B6I23_03105 [Rickettsiaceae bacterium 4572_127]|nr:MAG: hypothetical protein B6I23_03105 [Rickettsiaceae bacterium 4572_127]
MKQLRPLILASNMERGEISDYIVDTARYFQKHQIAPIVMSAGGYEVNRLRRAGITHIQVSTHSGSPFSFFKNYQKIKKIVKEYDINLIHSHTNITGWLAKIIKRKLNVPYVSTIHYPYIGIENSKLGVIENIKLRGRLDANHVFSSFSHIVKKLKQLPEIKEKISFLPRWVDSKFYSTENISSERLIALTQKWNVPDGLPLILNISEEDDANEEVFLRAIASIRERNFGVLMVRNWANHNDPKYLKLRKTAEKLGVYKNISVVLPEDDEPLMYKIGDLIICNTKVSFARIALQSQSMGKITLLPAVEGASSIINTDSTGKLFVPDNVDSLRESLIWGLELSKERKEEISTSAREMAKKLDINKILPKYLEICKKVAL